MTTKEYFQQYYLKNKEKKLERAKEWYKNNKEKKAAYDKERRKTSKDSLADYERERSKLPHRKALKRNDSRKRKMHIKQASPEWLTEFDVFFISELYDLAVRRSEALGIEFHVDHIIPLRGRNVCGLHIPSNLQLLDAKTNIKKHNNFQLKD